MKVKAKSSLKKKTLGHPPAPEDDFDIDDMMLAARADSLRERKKSSRQKHPTENNKTTHKQQCPNLTERQDYRDLIVSPEDHDPNPSTPKEDFNANRGRALAQEHACLEALERKHRITRTCISICSAISTLQLPMLESSEYRTQRRLKLNATIQ